jgi:nitrate reductase NapAB chaperone NapD
MHGRPRWTPYHTPNCRARVHGRTPPALVVVLTAASERIISDHLQTINAIAGVITASLVYHAVDDA